MVEVNVYHLENVTGNASYVEDDDYDDENEEVNCHQSSVLI